jgi:hypothetical protein
MATTLTQARKLLTAAELEVFIASRGQALTSLSPLQLRGKVKRARSLSEKYRDLLQRQKLATRDRAGSKTGRSGVANARTEQKAVVFGEVLASFSRRLAQVEAAQARAVQKAKASAVTKSKVKAVPAKPRSKAAAPKVGTTPRSSKAPAKSRSRPGASARPVKVRAWRAMRDNPSNPASRTYTRTSPRAVGATRPSATAEAERTPLRAAQLSTTSATGASGRRRVRPSRWSGAVSRGSVDHAGPDTLARHVDAATS